MDNVQKTIPAFGSPWRLQEIKYVRDNYHLKPAAQIAADLNRPLNSVKVQAFKMGVKRDRFRPVSEEFGGLQKQPKILRIMKLITVLQRGKFGINSLSKQIESTLRTTYRYLDTIQDLNIGLYKEGELYHIKEGNCPICGNSQQPTTNGTSAS